MADREIWVSCEGFSPSVRMLSTGRVCKLNGGGRIKAVNRVFSSQEMTGGLDAGQEDADGRL